MVLSKYVNDKVFGGENSVGREVTLSGKQYRVLGVMRPWMPQPRFYDLGFGKAVYTSVELRAIFLNADLIGLPLWLISKKLADWASRRRNPWVDRDSRAVLDETPAAAMDVRIFKGTPPDNSARPPLAGPRPPA